MDVDKHGVVSKERALLEVVPFLEERPHLLTSRINLLGFVCMDFAGVKSSLFSISVPREAY